MDSKSKWSRFKASKVAIPAAILGIFLIHGAFYWAELQKAGSLAEKSPEQLATLAGLAAGDLRNHDPSYLIALAERTIAATTAADQSSRAILRHALARNERQPFAWNQLAYVERRQAGKFNPGAEAALRRSIELCRLCDADLLKWRLQFVLANWDDVPEDLRLAVFEGADLLRWWQLEYDFLTETRIAAEQHGIPFSEYQQRIDTPVRPEEVGLKPHGETPPG